MQTRSSNPTRESEAALVRRLQQARDACSAAEQVLEATRELRDQAISDASDAGMSRRHVAELAGVTPGRVQQILGDLDPRGALLQQSLERMRTNGSLADVVGLIALIAVAAIQEDRAAKNSDDGPGAGEPATFWSTLAAGPTRDTPQAWRQFLESRGAK